MSGIDIEWRIDCLRQRQAKPESWIDMVKTTPLDGNWRITWMSGWDQDHVELEGPARIAFGARGSGDLRFGAIQAQLDCRVGDKLAGRIEFSWQGCAEGDELCGRGHAELVNGEPHWRLYFHLGDDSAFRATREAAAPRESPARRRKPASE